MSQSTFHQRNTEITVAVYVANPLNMVCCSNGLRKAELPKYPLAIILPLRIAWKHLAVLVAQADRNNEIIIGDN